MKERTKNRIQKEWALPKNRNFNFDLIHQYTSFQKNNRSTQLDEKAIIDLDFQSFFKFVDRTHSAIGQQLLYDQLLLQKLTKEKLEKQEHRINYYQSNTSNRLNSQFELSKISNTTDYYFPFLMYSELPDKMYPSWLIALLQISMFLGLVLILKFPPLFLFVLLLFTVNLSLHYLHKRRIGKYTVYFSRLSKLSSAIKQLLPMSSFSETRKMELLTDAKHIDNITSKIFVLKTDNLQNSELGSIFWFIFELLKVLTLSELSIFNQLIDKIESSRPHIERLYQAIGDIDIAISICSLRDGLPSYSIPNFEQEQKALKITSLYHPLVSNCVSNDIELQQKSLLLTGSNMAGKSTFIKAVNLNCLSSQTLNTSFSNGYTAPFFLLKTSMNLKDNLDNKSSFFMEEVRSIGELITCSEQEDKLFLFTIDEIFKGTNTIERISSSKAILEYLNRSKNLVLVSTHDVELTKLLREGFDLYFFQESISDASLSFDYKIKKGNLDRSNAINILEIAGYPKAIVEESKRLASQIQKEKTGHPIL